MSELNPCLKGHPAERFCTPSGTAVIARHKCGIRLTGVKKEITALWNRPGEKALQAEIAVLTSKLQIAEGRLTDVPEALAVARREGYRWVECDVCNGDGGVPSDYNPPESPDARYPIEYCPTCSGQGGKFVKEVTDG